MDGSIFAIILFVATAPGFCVMAWCAVQAQPNRPRYVPRYDGACQSVRMSS